MTAIIPQVITPDRATGAQVIDGSLKFDATVINRLDFTNSNKSTTFTASMWVKRHGLHTRTTSGSTPAATALGYQHFFFTSDTANSNAGCGLGFDTNEKITVYNGSHNVTDRVFRDTSSWYHLVLKVTSGTAELYVNNELAKSGVTGFELSDDARIGDYAPSAGYPSDISMSQVYLIDGQALGPEEFGFTDPLTNTWKPKKYTGDFNNLPDINLAGTGSGESIEVVINRQVNKAWIKNNGSSVYEGGGDPDDPLSAPSFHLPSGGSLYWFTTAYDSAHTMVIGSSSETGTQPEWASGGTTGSLTRDSATNVSGTPSSSYASARTEALADDTVYAFTFTITTGTSGNHTGWFLSTSSSYSSGTPDEQSGNTAGARFYGSSDAYYPYVAVYGSFATANPNVLHNSITKLSFRGKNSFYLPFDGNSPIGEDRSGIVTPNDGTTWTNFSEDPDSVKNSGDADELFNGNLSTGGVVLNKTTTASDQWYVALDGVSIPCAHNVAFYSGNGASTATMRINGNDTYKKEAGSTSVEWQYLTFTGTITKIELGYLDGSGSTNTFYGIKVDGTILIDGKKGNDWTPLNFGSNSLEKATGAKPILNTLGGVAAGVGVFGSKENVVHTISSASGGGSPYIFNNEGTRPILNLLRGATYTFDYTAATTHPLYFSSLSDGKHNSKAYSVEFNGSSQYLTVPAHADLNYGTGDFTVEWFQWWDGTPASGDYDSVYSNNYATNPNLLIQSGNNTTTYTVYMNGTGASVTETTAAPTGKWIHYAVVRSGTLKNNVKIYRDGRVTGKGTYTGAVGNSGSPVYIGYDQTYYLDGKISNLRAVKGTAVYTEEFDPPTTTLTNITNTVLLCCQDSNAATAAVIPTGSITVSGSAAATNSYNPFVYDNNHGNYGIDTGTSNTTKITVPHNGVDTLYYYCANHSGMGNSINVTTDETKTDPYAWRNYLALPLTGIATDISHQVNCTSTMKLDTVSGPSPYGDKGQRTNFYDSSHHWNVKSDTLQYAQQGDELVLGTDDFTIECWVYDDNGHDGTSGRRYIFDNRIGGSVTGDPPQLLAYVDGHSEWNVYIGNPVVEIVKDTVSTTHLNRWQHFAVTRENGIVRMFVNGIELGSVKSTTNFTNNGIGVGRATDANYGWSGNIQDFRVYKGVAKYTSNFIPASTKPDILPDTPSGVSGSSELVKITDGSSTFSGIGVTHLSVADSADFTMGTGDWTMECFAYPQTPTSATYGSLIQKYATTESDSSWFWSVYLFTTGYGTHNFYFYSGSQGWSYTQASTKISLDQWHHLAVVRDSNTIRTYVNGVQDGTISLGGSLSMNDTSCDLTIGADSQNNYAMTGSISNARIVKGTCLYPDGKSFTPPTQPLTTTSQGATDSEVKLLCCQSNATSGAAAKSPNISGVNDGTVWSNNVTYSGNVYSGGDNIFIPELAFNGLTVSSSNYDETAMGPYSNGVVTFNFPGTFSGNLKIQGRLHSGDTVKVNGSSISHTGNAAYATYNLGSVSNLESLSITGSIGNVSFVGQILLDDVVLIDPIISTRSDGPQMANVANTFNPFDTDIHTIRGQENNYATWNPLFNNTRTGANGILFNGNLEVEDTVHGVVLGNTLMASGKWYFEAYIENGNMIIGVMGEDWSAADTQSYAWNKAYGIYPAAPQFVQGGSFLTSPRPNTGAVSGTKAWYGVAVDIDNRKMWFRKDGIWVHNNPLSTNADVTLDANSPGFYAWFHSAAQDGNDCNANFGQKPFKFSPPDGFQPLTAANTRPVKVISRPDHYVGMTTYTGNNTVGRKIDIGRQADLIWVKKFNDGENNILVDTVRGPNNFLISDSADEINTSGGPITGLGSTVPNGFIVDNNGYVNANNSHYICWNWKAGGDKGTFNVDDIGYATAAAAGLDGGTITPTGASVGTEQGFSIIKYTANLTQGATISHGLTQKPDFAIFKNMDSNLGTNEVDWGVYHTSIGATKKLELNQNLAAEDHPGPFNDTEPTSSLFTFGGSPGAFGHSYMTNGPSGDDFIAYIWHDVPGLQKFGMYRNNKTTDGPFVELGFKPALFVIKRTDSTGNWWVYNAERNPTNLTTSRVLRWDEVNAETPASTSFVVDFLSNGFKIRSSQADLNVNSGTAGTYVYCAWAEAPSIDLYGGGANAR